MIRSGQLAGTVLNDAVNQAKATFEIARNFSRGKARSARDKMEVNQ